MGCTKCGCRMLTRSATIKNRLICCDCGSPIMQQSTQMGKAVNWWISLAMVAVLLATMGLLIARDQFSLEGRDGSNARESSQPLR